ncbi:MAG TPA: acyl carrier protein [Phaeodactylibacter sp.]|nr:acyl carrier protein [Phaeodactylibacter sp.]
MQINEIFEKVKEVIEESCGIDANEIELKKTLFGDLNIDSIDMVDILFELETEYDIELKISDLEKRSKEEMGGKPYEIGGVLTPEGLETLKKNMTEVNPNLFVEGLTVHQLMQLFTVHSLCKLVEYQIEQKKQSDENLSNLDR